METDKRIPEIKEAYNNLHTTLGDEIFKQYKLLLKLYFSAKITKVKFDEDARKLLTSTEHLHLHNLFLLSLSSKISSIPADNYELKANNVKYSSQEICLPNEHLVKDRILLTAFDHGLEGADEQVTEVIIIAVQMFLKNIITAMLSRSRGYKIRENNFQHSIGIPAPNPWLRNTRNIIDSTQESNIDVDEESATFQPKIRSNLENAEQQMAFSIACGSHKNFSATHRLTLKCLYDTLLENPSVINNHSIYSVNLERILSQLDCS